MWSRKRRPLEERFWEKVNILGEDECWEWTAAVNNKGYGVIGDGSVPSKNLLAHRVSYSLRYGSIDPSLLLCHKCDNTKCVNPGHLFQGTQTDNMSDALAKGRHHKTGLTHCPSGHEYAVSGTYTKSNGTRFCRVCHALRVRTYKAKQRFSCEASK